MITYLNFRELYYKETAEIVIDTIGKKIKDIVREIAMKTRLKT